MLSWLPGYLITILGLLSLVAADIPPQNNLPPTAPIGTITNGSLWGSTGPAIENIIQVKVYDCYWAAARLAVLVSSQNWIMNLFTYANGTSLVGVDTPSMDSVVVNLWNPNTMQPHSFTALLQDESVTEDQPNEWWWGDALTQGLEQLAATTNIVGLFPNGTFVPYEGGAFYVLPILTGYPTSSKTLDEYGGSIDAFFADLQKAPNTPLIIASGPAVIQSTPPVEPDHDYAVMSTDDYGNGTRTVTARNPWGATDVFHVEDLWTGSRALIHLSDWQALKWPGH